MSASDLIIYHYLDYRSIKPRSPLDLPVDILLYVTALFPRVAQSRFARTCRLLYDVLADELLKGPVHVRKSHASSLRQFLRPNDGPHHSKDGRRQILLKKIVLETSVFDYLDYYEHVNPASRTIMWGIVTQARYQLIYLSIRLTRSELPPIYELRAVLSCLHQLQELSLDDITIPRQCDLLDGIVPNLISVHIGLARTTYHPEDRNPFPMLGGHARTLRSLSLTNADLPDLAPSFPNVRVLALDLFCASSGVRTLIRLFPAVESVALRRGVLQRHLRAELDSYHYREIEAHRAACTSWQAAHGTWTSLKRLRVPYALGLYCLGLTVVVDTLETATPNVNAERMGVALRDLRPRCLSFDAGLTYDTFHERIHVYLSGLARAPWVTHVSVCVPTGLWLDILRGHRLLLGSLGFPLKTSAVSHLAIRIYHDEGEHHGCSPSVDEVYGYGGADTYVRFIMNSAPSIRRVFLDLDAQRVRCWERGDDCLPKRLSDAEGAKIFASQRMLPKTIGDADFVDPVPIYW
ncbi:hypothetical protein C8Q80DRAFT_1121751 [Daedaleopsis nitida]|nr:hypothetical protein C8Q80DRAFT_1121751 [Daedaleopsis nitida]